MLIIPNDNVKSPVRRHSSVGKEPNNPLSSAKKDKRKRKDAVRPGSYLHHEKILVLKALCFLSVNVLMTLSFSRCPNVLLVLT